MSDYSTHPTPSRISSQEFTVLVALLMSIVAISIDALLPALGFISNDIPLAHDNQAQYIISALFLGMAIGQLVCGPLSDASGRKKVLYGGIVLFFCGSLMCFFAQDINTLLIGRFIQGLGVAGPYVSAISIVRDKYAGNEMARVMSLVMMIFIMVPALAPSIGQAVLLVSSWRYIFVIYIVYALIIGIWIFFRLEETLPKEYRIPFLWLFMIYASVLFFCFGLVFGNVNAMAMEPMGHVAGIASAIIGATSSILSMLIGTTIGQMYNGTLVPVTSGFLILGIIALAILQIARNKKAQ